MSAYSWPRMKSTYAENLPGLRAPIIVNQWAPGLPKTRSGKIMRRILRKVAEGDLTNLGDISTLADASVVERLIQGRPNQ